MKKEDKPCQTCKNKMTCLERLRLNLDVLCKSDEHEKHEKE